jgi:DNA-binding GntR family transcriptional regulator
MTNVAKSPRNDSPSAPRLDRSRHAAPQVLDYLRGQIISLELPPGSALSRQDVALNFGLSQTPVRDALIHLAEEGLVDVFAQHKTVVSRIDIRSAKQSHFLRRSIELEIVRVLARQPDPELEKRLRTLVERQIVSLAAGDYQQFLDDDQAFHRQMYEAANVPDLYAIVQRHSGHIDRLRRLHVPLPGKASSIIDDHRRIIDAIASGNPEEAMRCVETHLSGTLSWIDDVRAEFPDFVTN